MIEVQHTGNPVNSRGVWIDHVSFGEQPPQVERLNGLNGSEGSQPCVRDVTVKILTLQRFHEETRIINNKMED